MEPPLWREILSRILGSHNATELVDAVYRGTGCQQETIRLQGISCTKTGCISLTHNQVLLLVILTCGDVDSDMHILIMELTIRRAEHRLDMGPGAKTGTGTEGGQGLKRDGKGNENEEGRVGGGELWYPPHQEISREDQALPFRTRYYLCTQKVVYAGSQLLWAQDPASTLRGENRAPGPEDDRGGGTPTSNQQQQPQDPTPQRDRRITLRTRAQGRDARYSAGGGGGETKKSKKNTISIGAV